MKILVGSIVKVVFIVLVVLVIVMLASCNDEAILMVVSTGPQDGDVERRGAGVDIVDHLSESRSLLGTPLFRPLDGGIFIPPIDGELLSESDPFYRQDHPKIVHGKEACTVGVLDSSMTKDLAGEHLGADLVIVLLGQDISVLHQRFLGVDDVEVEKEIVAMAIIALLPDPNNRPDKEGEWIVLHNRSNEDISIGRWQLSDGKQDTLTFGDNVFVRADSFLVIGRSRTAVIEGEIYTSDLVSSDFRLSNVGESISLYDEQGTLISIVEYKDASPGQAIYVESP